MSGWDQFEAVGPQPGNLPAMPASSNPWDKYPAVQEMRSAPSGTRIPAESVKDDSSKGASVSQAFLAGLPPDDAGKIQMLSQKMGIPVQRFGVMHGDIVYVGDDGNTYKAIPSVTGATGPLDALKRLGTKIMSEVGPNLPGIVGGATGIVTAPFAGGVPGAAGGAAATDVARQSAANAILGRDTGIDWANVAGQSALAGGGQGLARGAGALLNRNALGIGAADRTAALDPARQAEIAALEAEAKKRGIDLSAGQATNLRSVQMQERQVGRFPETTDQLAQFSRTQRGEQVPNAVRQEIANISPNAGTGQSVANFRQGANAVVEGALDARAAQAKTAYEAALDPARPAPFTDDLKTLMSRPSMQQAWAAAQKLAKEEGRTLPNIVTFDASGAPKFSEGVQPDWRSWDYIKRGLDSVIEANTNELGRVNSVGRAVGNTKAELLKILDAANPDYAKARALYGSSSDAVSQILNGGVGKINDMSGMDRVSLVNRFFNAKEITPEAVQKARSQFKMAGKESNWNDGVSAWLADRLDDAMKINANGEAGNVPGKVYAKVWGDPKQRDILKAALGGNTAQTASMESLMKVLQAAARGLPEGSPTATDLASQGGIQTVGRGAQIVGKLLSPNTAMNLGNELVAGIDALRTPAARQKLANALLSGDYAKELAKLRMLPPKGEAAFSVAAQILMGAGVTGAGGRTPSDFAPPALSGTTQNPQ